MTKLSALLYFVTAFVPYEALVVIHRSRSFSKHQEDRRIARTVIYTSEKSDNDDDDIILGAKDEAVPSDLKEQVLAALLADDEKEDEKEDEKREVKKSGVITLNLSANSGKWKAQNKKKKKNEGRSRALSRIAEFGLRPREVREHLDRYVIRQDAAKKVLSVAICDHYNVVKRCLSDAREREAEYSKPNILLLGPSGSGKTYIMRTLAKLLGVPFVKADATKFTEAGIVGEDAEDLVRELVQRADNDVELAQYGIIYVDEIDKLCGGGHGRDGGAGFVGGGVVTNSPQRGVQSSFLKIMEDTEITIHKPFSPELLFGGSDSGRSTGPSKISTKHILFIFSGAFTGLDATLRKNREYRGLGFDSDLTSNNNNNIYATQKIVDSPLTKSYLGEATSADLIRAGLEPEFVGRVPVRVAVEQLSARDLEEILQNSQGSVLKQYERDFSGYGIELDIRPEFIRAIALQAAQENTGARGLVTVLERTFRDFKYTLPCAGIHTLLCTERTVLDPATDLTHLLKSLADPQEADHVRRNDVRRFAKDLGRAAGGLDLFFSTEATISLLAQSKIEDLAVTTICKRSLGWDILEIAERILPQDKTNAHDDDDDDDDDDNQKVIYLGVEGMSCAACSSKVERALKKLEFVDEAAVSSTTHRAKVIMNESLGSKEESEKILIDTIHSLGFKGWLQKKNAKGMGTEEASAAEVQSWLNTVIMAALCTVPLFLIKLCSNNSAFWKQDFVCALSRQTLFEALLGVLTILAVGSKFAVNAFRGIATGNWGMDLLVTTATGIIFGYSMLTLFDCCLNEGGHEHAMFDTAATLLLFVSLGKYLEAAAKKKKHQERSLHFYECSQNMLSF
mmetsp:Transcript_8115/g.12405  ORF Transcript_8115/g.12405 Transcript_8115/m.12405 type:complete len:850 (+) Transcript_8115:44-2593(+)